MLCVSCDMTGKCETKWMIVVYATRVNHRLAKAALQVVDEFIHARDVLCAEVENRCIERGVQNVRKGRHNDNGLFERVGNGQFVRDLYVFHVFLRCQKDEYIAFCHRADFFFVIAQSRLH